jgi:hypothetical protein
MSHPPRWQPCSKRSLQTKQLEQQPELQQIPRSISIVKGMRDKLEHLLQMIAKMLSPDTGLSGINISQVITKWERRKWEGASAKFESVSNYLNDFMMKLSVDLGLWI